jgi:hypothetical protein
VLCRGWIHRRSLAREKRLLAVPALLSIELFVGRPFRKSQIKNHDKVDKWNNHQQAKGRRKTRFLEDFPKGNDTYNDKNQKHKDFRKSQTGHFHLLSVK